MSKLTKHEQYLFSLTNSTAQTVNAQKNAIKKAGLEGKSKKELRKVALDKFKIFKNETKNKGIPLYVLKRRFNEFSLYKLEGAGKKVVSCDVATLAFIKANWGRLRKINIGKSALYSGIRTETNGKSGWDCVYNHFSDYVLIKSPDNKKIFIEFNGTKVEKSLYKNKFILNGETLTLSKTALPKPHTARNQCKILKKVGFQAKVVRQTAKLVTIGSDKTEKVGDLYCIVKRNNNWYHCDNQSIISAADLKLKFDRFSKEEKEKELNEKCMLLIKNEPNKIWVSKEDSLAAGNCLPGTEMFEIILNKTIKTDYPIGAIRADVLLTIRNDNFVLNAVKYAARRVA